MTDQPDQPDQPDQLIDEVVNLPVADLQLIRAALNSAYHHSTVVDLTEGYRKLSITPQYSNLTKSLRNALTLSDAYLEEAATKEPGNA